MAPITVPRGARAAACALLALVAGCAHDDVAPTIANQPPAVATEDVAYVHQAIVRDPDGPGATWSTTRDHTCGGAIDAATGVFSFTPAGPLPRAGCVVALRVCDGSARNLCAIQVTTVTIEAVDDPPTIESVAPTQAIEGVAYVYAARASDPDGPTARWALAAGHDCGGAIDAATGVFGFTPGAMPPSTCTLAIAVCDGASPERCAGQTALVDIFGRNDPPVIGSSAPTVVAEGTMYTYAATATDPDGPGATWSLALGHNCGGAIDAATGVFTFLPARPAPPATCWVAIQVCDGGWPDLCARQTTAVTIVLDDDPPLAVDDHALDLRPTAPLALDVLRNDLDADTGPRAIAAVTQPAHGTVAIVGGGTGVTYLATAGWCSAVLGARDTFTYTLAPGGSIATVAVWVACPPGDRARLATGDAHTCAIPADGTLWCWGANDQGQLGDGTLVARAVPTQVGAATTWATVEAGAIHTCATRTDGTLWCWGQNDGTQLGDGTAVDRPLPIQVGTGTDWATVAAGDAHTCATRTDGTLWCWGWNGRGQLGDGSVTYRPRPVRIGTDANWVTVTTGNSHTCGLRTDGTVWCWGEGRRGQLGGGSWFPASAIPQWAGGGTTWISVRAGRDHTCGTHLDGTVRCWGANGDGQLGDGGGPDRTSPALVGLGVAWATVSAGARHSCATGYDGSLWCWGANDAGWLGDGTLTARPVPTRIGLASDWTAVSAGATLTCAIRSDGSRWCWGGNDVGQLGDGSGQDHAVPTRVP